MTEEQKLNREALEVLGGVKHCQYPGCNRPLRRDNKTGHCGLHYQFKLCPVCKAYYYRYAQQCSNCVRRGIELRKTSASRPATIDLSKLKPITDRWKENARRVRVYRPKGWSQKILEVGHRAEGYRNSTLRCRAFGDWHLDKVLTDPFLGRVRREKEDEGDS